VSRDLWGLSTTCNLSNLHPRFGVLSWATITLSPVKQERDWLMEDTVCLELIRHKDDSVSIIKISEVIVFNCSSLILWNLQLNTTIVCFEWRMWHFRRGSKHTLTLLHIFRGSGPPNLRIYSVYTVSRLTCFCSHTLCSLIRVVYSVRRPCSDFTDMLLRLTNCRIIIIIIIINLTSNDNLTRKPKDRTHTMKTNST